MSPWLQVAGSPDESLENTNDLLLPEGATPAFLSMSGRLASVTEGQSPVSNSSRYPADGTSPLMVRLLLHTCLVAARFSALHSASHCTFHILRQVLIGCLMTFTSRQPRQRTVVL